MKEIVIISGKGGTGKTSIAASFAAIAGNSVMADCDVDAADLHIVLNPKIRRREPFTGGKIARIKSGYCIACGKCEEICRFNAISFTGPGNGKYPKTFQIDPIACEGCGVCFWYCAEKAIEFEPEINGEWYISETRFGPMVHAKLGIAEENSGKLVTMVKRASREIAEMNKSSYIITDGSPGIGCPVIASVSGADLIVAVTEPTMSGKHDLERVIELAKHFRINAVTIINKWDINENMTNEIEGFAKNNGAPSIGKISYDKSVTKAQVNKTTVIEYAPSKAAEEIKEIWNKITQIFMRI